jgi:hypothetical protein
MNEKKVDFDVQKNTKKKKTGVAVSQHKKKLYEGDWKKDWITGERVYLLFQNGLLNSYQVIHSFKNNPLDLSDPLL